MFTDHKKFAAAPPTGGVSAEEKQALVGEPVVYGLPAKPREPVATVTYNELIGRLRLRVFGVEVRSCPRFSERAEGLYATAEQINNAAKEKGL